MPASVRLKDRIKNPNHEKGNTISVPTRWFYLLDQTILHSDDDVAYRVYKEYDKNGNLVRYDSSKVDKRPGFIQKFHFNFSSDSLPFVEFKFDSLMNTKRNFLYKGNDFLDCIISHKYAPSSRILKLDSLFEHLTPNDFYLEFDSSEKSMDSILNHHFNRMEGLFEKYFKKEEALKKKKTVL